MESASRANRRRRWWLRAIKSAEAIRDAALLADAAGEGIANSTDRPDGLSESRRDRCRRECGVPPDARLMLRQRWTGRTLTIPLTDACTVLGSAAGCQVRIVDRRIAPRAAAFVWVAGQLALIDLRPRGGDQHSLVRAWTVSTRARFGSWEAQVIGLPALADSPAAAPRELCVELSWSAPGRRLPTPVPHGLSVLGTDTGCSIGVTGATVAAVQAALVRVAHGLWVFDLHRQGTTRVNGRPVEFSALDPGDVLGLGEQTAWLTAHWPAESTELAASVAPEPLLGAHDSEIWQQLLLDQSARLTLMQQSLTTLLGPTNSHATTEARIGALQQIRQLAAECQQEASEALQRSATILPQSERSEPTARVTHTGSTEPTRASLAAR